MTNSLKVLFSRWRWTAILISTWPWLKLNIQHQKWIMHSWKPKRKLR